jgi:hypothetical protein
MTRTLGKLIALYATWRAYKWTRKPLYVPTLWVTHTITINGIGLAQRADNT